MGKKTLLDCLTEEKNEEERIIHLAVEATPMLLFIDVLYFVSF